MSSQLSVKKQKGKSVPNSHRLPPSPLALLPSRIFGGICSNLDIKSLSNLLSTGRQVRRNFYTQVNDAYSQFPPVDAPHAEEVDEMINSIREITVNDCKIAQYLPQFYIHAITNCGLRRYRDERSGRGKRWEEAENVWNVMGVDKRLFVEKGMEFERRRGGKKFLWQTSAIMKLEYLSRLDEIAAGLHNIIIRACDTSRLLMERLEIDRAALEQFMYRILIVWTQSHLFGTQYNPLNGEIISVGRIKPGVLPIPQLPVLGNDPANIAYLEGEVEKHMISAISNLLWPAHTLAGYWTDQGRSDWDRQITTMVKIEFVRTVYPPFLVKMLNLRRPDPELGAVNDEWKYEATIRNFEGWLRVILETAQGGERWGFNADTKMLEKVWGCLKEFRGGGACGEYFDRVDMGCGCCKPRGLLEMAVELDDD
ncbi:hypothetical protein H072_6039 [Dactylellina haptotyla CBS 200.50]|uniref:F-box domain-containing protein n=1 Tax=Dactylellina haptotyla (strain CBS 200.50) TaxID=1284197 RepID=S8BXV6_DACHA|nr:hypothetical protein H072_6039 [Dactylellina haptotyla CBS 200.50]